MANRTDPSAKQIHGMNPQFLLETIIRNKIYTCFYWKEKCFALTNETIIDAAVELQYIGGKNKLILGCYGGNKQPTDFICLLLKLLQLQPDKEIVLEYLNNKDYKYLTALAAFYMRLTFRPVDLYQNLEYIYSDFRKLRVKCVDGSYEIIRMDEYIDDLFLKEAAFEVTLPVIPKRYILEQNNEIEPRISLLDADLMLDEYEVKDEEKEATIDTVLKKDFFQDSDEEIIKEPGEFKNENNGVQEKRWEKVDLSKEESFDRNKNFENFDKKRRRKSRSRSRDREKKKDIRRSRSNSRKKKNRNNDYDDRDYKKDKYDRSDKHDRKNNKREEEIKKIPDENSVEYWNSLRAKLGLNLIPDKL